MFVRGGMLELLPPSPTSRLKSSLKPFGSYSQLPEYHQSIDFKPVPTYLTSISHLSNNMSSPGCFPTDSLPPPHFTMSSTATEEEGTRQGLNREGRQQPHPEDAVRTLAEADKVVLLGWQVDLSWLGEETR